MVLEYSSDYTLHVGVNDRFMVSILVYESDRDTFYAFADRIDYHGIAALVRMISSQIAHPPERIEMYRDSNDSLICWINVVSY